MQHTHQPASPCLHTRPARPTGVEPHAAVPDSLFQSDFLPARLVRFTSCGPWLVAGASLVACSAEPPGEETMPVTVPSSSQPVPTASVPTPGVPTELPPGPGVNPTSTNPGTVSPPPEPVNPV